MKVSQKKLTSIQSVVQESLRTKTLGMLEEVRKQMAAGIFFEADLKKVKPVKPEVDNLCPHCNKRDDGSCICGDYDERDDIGRRAPEW